MRNPADGARYISKLTCEQALPAAGHTVSARLARPQPSQAQVTLMQLVHLSIIRSASARQRIIGGVTTAVQFSACKRVAMRCTPE